MGNSLLAVRGINHKYIVVEGRSNLYEPLITEKEYLAAESRSFLDRVFHGSVASFATALCDSGVTKEELEELRRFLEEGGL